MNFPELTIENFLTIGADCPPLKLANRGLVLIEGTNGVGKSSIVDALCWALYNVTARGETGDAVVNNKAKKNCRVAVEIDDDGTLYRVSRHRKHKEHKNMARVEKFGDEGWLDMTRATDKDTQDLIEEILGCSKEVFVSAIYAGQDAVPDLPKMTDKMLKSIIEEAAGVDKFEAAYEIARSKMNDIKRNLEVLVSALDAHKSSKELDEKSLESVEAQVKEFEDGRKGRYDEAIAKANEHKKTIAVMAAEYKSFNTESLLEKLKECEKSLDAAKPAQDAYEKAQKELHAAEMRLTTATNALKHNAGEAKLLQDKVKNAPEEMKKPCPECGKPHTEEELGEYVEHAKARLVSQLEVVRKNRATRDEIAKEVETLAEAVKVAQGAIPDVSAVSSEHSKISAELRRANDLKGTLGRQMTTYKSVVAQAEGFMTEPNPILSSKKMLEERISATAEKIEKGEKNREVLEDELQIAEDVVKVFSPAGVRAHILDTVTPFLNERTDDYLSIMSDGKISAVWSTLGETAKGELREKFNIAVNNTEGGGSFGLQSGGEKRRVRLATMMALQDLQASRATKPIMFFAADEIDGALDTPGLEGLMMILERRAKERGTVIIISHNSLRDWCDNVTTMTKLPNGSVAEGVLVE